MKNHNTGHKPHCGLCLLCFYMVMRAVYYGRVRQKSFLNKRSVVLEFCTEFFEVVCRMNPISEW